MYSISVDKLSDEALEIDILLQGLGNGAHAHSINKTRYYLMKIDSLEFFPDVRQAIQSGDWSTVSNKYLRSRW